MDNGKKCRLATHEPTTIQAAMNKHMQTQLQDTQVNAARSVITKIAMQIKGRMFGQAQITTLNAKGKTEFAVHPNP